MEQFEREKERQREWKLGLVLKHETIMNNVQWQYNRSSRREVGEISTNIILTRETDLSFMSVSLYSLQHP